MVWVLLVGQGAIGAGRGEIELPCGPLGAAFDGGLCGVVLYGNRLDVRSDLRLQQCEVRAQPGEVLHKPWCGACPANGSARRRM